MTVFILFICGFAIALLYLLKLLFVRPRPSNHYQCIKCGDPFTTQNAYLGRKLHTCFKCRGKGIFAPCSQCGLLTWFHHDERWCQGCRIADYESDYGTDDESDYPS